jgi:hypothetical protein
LLLWLPFILGWLWSVWQTTRDYPKVLGAD